MGGLEVVFEVKGVEERGARRASTGAQIRGDGWGEIEFTLKRCCLGHYLALDAGKEYCAFGEDFVLIGLR